MGRDRAKRSGSRAHAVIPTALSSSAMKRFSDACERNRAPILAILKRVFADRTGVLEIGSGTGQHAAYFAPELPHLSWQPSDIAGNLPSIRSWREEAAEPRPLEPIELDVDRPFPAV